MTRQRAIYLKCLECSGESAREVTLCSSLDCPLWEYRCGCSLDSRRYAERVKAAFTKDTEAAREIRSLGLGIADYLEKHAQAIKKRDKRGELAQGSEEPCPSAAEVES